jgi:hypothetical protein
MTAKNRNIVSSTPHYLADILSKYSRKVTKDPTQITEMQIMLLNK